MPDLTQVQQDIADSSLWSSPGSSPGITNTQAYVLQRLANVNGAAGGSNLLPLQLGSSRVPVVVGLRVLQSMQLASGTAVVLGWAEPRIVNATTIDHYEIYAFGLPGLPAGQPYGPFVVTSSPALVLIPGRGAATVVFRIQTVLQSGFRSSLVTSSSAAATLAATPDAPMTLRVPAVDADFYEDGSHNLLAFPALTAARTITFAVPQGLPAGKSFVIKDEGGTGAAHTISMTCVNTGAKLDGAGLPAVLINANFGVARIYTNGVDFFRW